MGIETLLILKFDFSSDCLSIPTVMLLSYIFLHQHYNGLQCLAVLLSIIGNTHSGEIPDIELRIHEYISHPIIMRENLSVRIKSFTGKLKLTYLELSAEKHAGN